MTKYIVCVTDTKYNYTGYVGKRGYEVSDPADAYRFEDAKTAINVGMQHRAPDYKINVKPVVE